MGSLIFKSWPFNDFTARYGSRTVCNVLEFFDVCVTNCLSIVTQYHSKGLLQKSLTSIVLFGHPGFEFQALYT